MVANWLAELDGRRIAVEVPATSANLGAGYDCLGLALDLTDRIEVEVRSWSRGEIELEIDGEGVDELTEDRDNRFVQSLESTLVTLRGEIPEGVGWRISMRNRIPLCAALARRPRRRSPGSSRPTPWPTATSPRPTCSAWRRRSRAIPTMSGAALLGGFVASAALDGTVEALRFDVPRDLRCVLFIPELRLPDRRRCARRCRRRSRSRMRRPTWPGSRSASPGWPAAGSTSCATSRSTGSTSRTGRRSTRSCRRLVEAAREAGALGACLSGSGSAVIAFTDTVAAVARIEAAFSAVAADTDLPGQATVVTPAQRRREGRPPRLIRVRGQLRGPQAPDGPAGRDTGCHQNRAWPRSTGSTRGPTLRPWATSSTGSVSRSASADHEHR